MAGRNRNTFLKRQKEIDRTRKAREKMERRHGKKMAEAEPGMEGQESEAGNAEAGDAGAEVLEAGVSSGVIALQEEDARVQLTK
jgi:hypothetical protein